MGERRGRCTIRNSFVVARRGVSVILVDKKIAPFDPVFPKSLPALQFKPKIGLGESLNFLPVTCSAPSFKCS